MSAFHILRIARPTDQLDRLALMYAEGLGFQILDRFENHEGFDGIIVGKPGAPYHLEFTTSHHAAAETATSAEHLLVFYLPDRTEWAAACIRMARAGFRNATSANPYWAVRGKTFQDIDGGRVVLQNAPWPE